MTKSVIHDALYWLNKFPLDTVVYYTLILAAILQVLPNPNYDKLYIDFRPYSQLHTGTNNSTNSITIGVISLWSSGERNVYYLMSLATEEKFHAFNWTELTVDYYVIGGF